MGQHRGDDAPEVATVDEGANRSALSAGSASDAAGHATDKGTALGHAAAPGKATFEAVDTSVVGLTGELEPVQVKQRVKYVFTKEQVNVAFATVSAET